jgi:hypothetical protein
MTPEQRRQRVAYWRERRLSTRAIAAKVGADPKTVRNDLRTSGGEFSPPVTVAGLDGKTHPADKTAAAYGDAYEGPILCERCTRVGAETPPGCAKCRQARQTQANRAGARIGPQKNGQMRYDWKPFHAHFGGLVRQVCAFGNLYGVKESREADALRDLLGEFYDRFRAWTQDVSGIAPPSH